MFRKLLIILLLVTALCPKSYSLASISGKIIGKVDDIKYFPPIENFGNTIIPFYCKPKPNGEFIINIDIDKPSSVKFVFQDKVVWLLLEPNDSILLTVNTYKTSVPDIPWIEIEGNNAAGHKYYNVTFNDNPIKKFDGIRSVFSDDSMLDEEILLKLFKNELLNQTRWVDSLLINKLVTKLYARSVKSEINSLIAGEACVLIDNMSEIKPDRSKRKYHIKSDIFSIVNPLDTILYTSAYSQPYFSEYFKEIYKQNPGIVDSQKVIINEVPYYSLAPKEIAINMWGRAMILYSQISPGKYNYCEVYKKYVGLYGENVYSKYMTNRDVCSLEKSSSVKIITTKQVDFFALLSELPPKRYYIDIWATWCIPCKLEFASYTKELYDFLKDNKIETLFISIDEISRESRWREEVTTLKLNGYHILATKELLRSIKEVLYNNNEVQIPKYIIVNENGQIMTNSAKRPSDSSLKSEILRHFSK